MNNPKGFMNIEEKGPKRRPADVRLNDWKEVYIRPDPADVSVQAERCMDCGVAFCHKGCPLGNLIPEWNDDLPVSVARWTPSGWIECAR